MAKRLTKSEQLDAEHDTDDSLLPKLDRGLVQAIADGGDLNEALRLGSEYVEARFSMEYGSDMAEVLLKLDPSEDRAKRALRVLRDLERQLDAEPIQIHAAQENGGIDAGVDIAKEVPISKFQLRDKINGTLGVLGSIGVACATYLGVRATFQVSDLDIFYEAPILLDVLPILPVALAATIKMAGNAFTYQETRDAYRRVVIFTGIGAGLLWLPLFSGVFGKGFTGTFDPYAEPAHLLSLMFNATHLVAEAMIGAGLFAILDGTILAKYAPSHKIDNPARKPLEQAHGPASAALDEAVDASATLTGRRDVLMGIKKAAHILVETAIRQKFNETPRDSLL